MKKIKILSFIICAICSMHTGTAPLSRRAVFAEVRVFPEYKTKKSYSSVSPNSDALVSKAKDKSASGSNFRYLGFKSCSKHNKDLRASSEPRRNIETGSLYSTDKQVENSDGCRGGFNAKLHVYDLHALMHLSLDLLVTHSDGKDKNFQFQTKFYSCSKITTTYSALRGLPRNGIIEEDEAWKFRILNHLTEPILSKFAKISIAKFEQANKLTKSSWYEKQYQWYLFVQDDHTFQYLTAPLIKVRLAGDISYFQFDGYDFSCHRFASTKNVIFAFNELRDIYFSLFMPFYNFYINKRLILDITSDSRGRSYTMIFDGAHHRITIYPKGRKLFVFLVTEEDSALDIMSISKESIKSCKNACIVDCSLPLDLDGPFYQLIIQVRDL